VGSQLAEVERDKRTVRPGSHAKRAARVQHEDGGAIWSEPTENLDLAHRGDVTLPEVESPTT
jgi:hypothetical protein